MLKINEEEKEILTDQGKNDDMTNLNSNNKKKKTKKHRKRRKKSHDEKENEQINKENIEAKQKSLINSDQFNINNRFHLIKMLGFGSFGEIHLAYDSQTRLLNAIKFELITQKNPQLKHEFNILDYLNKTDNINSNNNTNSIEGIPKVLLFDRMENKANFMIMEFLGPSLSDLFHFKNKQFSLTTVLLIGIQMLQRIEFLHEKGFIHRDIKPENFVLGLNEKSNTVYLIDYGLSKRYKDKNTGQHIPYRENRHLIGTARYASLNAHLGIEQSRRDDIESIGYVLVYFLTGRLPWQSKFDKSKLSLKIMEKKLVTPPEILCKKLPMEFSYYFHYCRNLKFEDRPDYSSLKSLFYDLLMSQPNNSNNTEFMFDWYNDETPFMEEKNDENPQNQTFALNMKNAFQNTLSPNDKDIFQNETPTSENFNIEDNFSSPKKGKVNNNVRNIFQSEDDESNDGIVIKNRKHKINNSNTESSEEDTERLGEEKDSNEDEIIKIIKNNSDSNKIDNSDSNYNLFQKSSTEKSSKHKNYIESDKKLNADFDDIIIKNTNQDIIEDNQKEVNLVIKQRK